MSALQGRLASALVLLALLAPVRAAAQVTDASAVTLGLAGNGTATARGLTALSMNAAGLGMPGGGVALAVLPVQLRAGLHPITLADLSEYEDVLLPRATALQWIDDVIENGSQMGDAGVDVSVFALTAGRVGFQLSTLAVVSTDMTPEIVELLLVGNAGRTGTPADLELGGSELQGFAVTTASASVGFPLTFAGGSMAFGATLKYTLGHVLLVGVERPGAASSDAIDVTFPIVATADDADGLQNGSGVGLDVGFQLERDRFGLGITVLNLLNTFAWDEDKLGFRQGTVFRDVDGSTVEFDEEPFANAPDALAEAVDNLGFKPILAVGGSYLAAPYFTLSVDVRKRLGGGLAREPEFHAGLGAEYTGLEAIELRGGVAAVTEGIQLAAGTSIVLGPVNLSLAGGLRRGHADGELVQLTLSFGGR